MARFVAHYSSKDASEVRAKGAFDFESDARLGSKANAHDARVKMLEIFGSDALCWMIVSIDHKKTSDTKATSDGQLELDFREPASIKKNRRRTTKRGVI